MERLSGAELGILAAVLPGELPVGRLAQATGLSMSYASECIRRLRELDLVRTRKTGLAVLVCRSEGPVMAALAVLLTEGSGLDLSRVLAGPGLTILPHLLAPGRTTAEILKRTTLSQATVRGRLRLWRGMGLVVRESPTGLYRLEPGRRALEDFVTRYSEARNARLLERMVPGALIIWQDRDEFLFSVASGGKVDGFVPAGPGALEDLGYDIAHSRDYWFGGPAGRPVGEEEALVQTMLIERGNPRPLRWIRSGLKGRRIDSARLLDFARRYGLDREIAKMLEDIDGAEKVRPK